MICLSNIPGRKYKLPRTKKKLYIKQFGKNAYSYQRILFYLKNNGLTKTINSIKKAIAKIGSITNAIINTLKTIANKLEQFVRDSIMLKMEQNIPTFEIQEIPVLDGVVYELTPKI